MGNRAPTHFADTVDTPAWSGRIGVLSPHLDDAVLSLGASMRAAARRGAQVDVVTVLAGDPASRTPADDSNRRAGYATAGEASCARRAEDGLACRALGLTAVWLPFSDDRNDALPPDYEVSETLTRQLSVYDTVLLPGFPLTHPHHLWAARLALRVLPAGRAFGLYVEQPYATWAALSRERTPRVSTPEALERLGLEVSGPLRWRLGPTEPPDRAAKLRAAGAYRSQLRVLRRAPRARIALYEALRGGERVLWCALAPAPPVRP